MKTYFAIFSQEDNDWCVRFPDAESVHTSGKDLDEAIFMAADALGGLLVLGRKGREYNSPRSFEEIQKEAKTGELVFPVVPSQKALKGNKPKKRINISVPVDLLDRVNTYLEPIKNLDRSAFFSKAAAEVLDQKH
ncbi:MAG: hypothetical protein GY786_01745 [Proteobacteria bacterium]|nr:hypothetical protein [Pseudomonadota bacterium]